MVIVEIIERITISYDDGDDIIKMYENAGIEGMSATITASVFIGKKQ